MAKTGEQSTKQTKPQVVSWLETSKNRELIPVLEELEERCKGQNGVSCIYVQVEGKLSVLLSAVRDLLQEVDLKTTLSLTLDDELNKAKIQIQAREEADKAREINNNLPLTA